MAKVKLNPALQQVRRTIGRVCLPGSIWRADHLETAGHVEGDMERGEVEHRQRFRRAVAYAQAALADEKVRAVYAEEAAQKGKRPFDLAVSDYFKGRNLLAGGECMKHPNPSRILMLGLFFKGRVREWVKQPTM